MVRSRKRRKAASRLVKRSPRTTESKEKGKRFPLLRILGYLVSLFILFYLIYFIFTVLSVRTTDIVRSNATSDYLLSRQRDSLEKILLLFERSSGDDKRITDVYEFLLNRDKKSELLIYIPGDVYYGGLEEKFGNEIPVSSFRYAGDFLQKGRGVEYSIWQLSQLLGFKNTKYIFFSAEATDFIREHYGDFEGEDGVEKLKSFNRQFSTSKIFISAFNLNELNDKIYSNMKFYDIGVAMEQMSVGNTKFSRGVIDVSDEKYLKKSKLSTGEEINVFNSSVYDKDLNKELQKVLDRKLENERARVEVYNGSELSGVAYSVGRKIMNSGCDVVRYGNAPDTEEKTKVYVANMEDFSNSYLAVADVISSGFDLIVGRPEFMTTGDIVVVLGKDIKSIYSF